jgi:Tol biopolymer transport system component
VVGDRIEVINADGTGLRVINPPCAGSCATQCALASLPCPGDDFPAWSPDGTRIAFERAYGSNLQHLTVAIWVANVDGTYPRQLTEPLPEEEDHSPSFSPNGRELVFMRDVHLSTTLDRASLWAIGVDGKGLHLVYQFPLDRPGGGFNARWSPDGSQIVFSDDCGFDSCRAVPAFVPQIFSIRPDGTDLQQLTHGPEGAYLPAWSPDGHWIVFVRSVAGSVPGCLATPPRDLYVMQADGTGIRQVTTDACFPSTSDWGV